MRTQPTIAKKEQARIRNAHAWSPLPEHKPTFIKKTTTYGNYIFADGSELIIHLTNGALTVDGYKYENWHHLTK